MSADPEVGKLDRDPRLLARLRASASEDLRELARLHDREPSQDLIGALREVGFPGNLGLCLRTAAGRWALESLARAVAELPDPVDQNTLDWLAVDYADIYLNYRLRASPYESVWLDEDGLERQRPMFAVRAWYRRYGLGVADWRTRSEDHLVNQLQFVAHLLGADERIETLREAAQFLDEHLLLWLEEFVSRVAGRCDTHFFGGVALLTAAYVDELRDLLAAVLGEARPKRAELPSTADARRGRRSPAAGP